MNVPRLATRERQGWAYRHHEPAFTALVLVLILLVSAASASAQSRSGGSDEFETSAPSAILLDTATGSVLFEKGADELVAPASTSKLMTLTIVFDALKGKLLSLDDEVRVSENAWRKGGAPSRTSAMMVPVNTSVSVSELLRGVIVASGNDASIAFAEHLAGSEETFARMLEKKAREIGLVRSTFRNATGLPDPEHLMTAREIGLLARHIVLNYPEFYPLFGEREFRYRTHRFVNRNQLLTQDIGVDGMKTGFTRGAGYNLVASAVQDGRRLIAVVTGLDTQQGRTREARRMLEWGFSVAIEVTLFEPGEIVSSALVWGGSRLSVPLIAEAAAVVVVPRQSIAQRMRAEIVYQGPLRAPIQRGQQVATLRVTAPNRASAEVPLKAAEDVPKTGFVWRGMQSLYFIARRSVGL